MRRQRQGGWCLFEVFVIVVVGASVATTAALLVHEQQRTSRVMGTYAQGLRELRGVLTEIGDDVRAGRDLEAAGWTLVDHRLLRGERVRATRVGAFRVTREGAITTIRLSPMSRVPGAKDESTTTLTLHVATRGGA